MAGNLIIVGLLVVLPFSSAFLSFSSPAFLSPSFLDISFSSLSGFSSSSVSDGFYLNKVSPCVFRAKLVPHKEEFSLSDCTECTCHNGEVTCRTEGCPHLQCKASEREFIPGKCCPKCPGIQNDTTLHCSYRGMYLSQGQQIQLDPCTECTCRSGTTFCVIAGCKLIECPSPSMDLRFFPDECCPRCLSVHTVIPPLKWKLTEIERSFYGRETLIRLDVRVEFKEYATLEGAGLWRVDIFGSSYPDGSGPRLTEINQTLDDGKAAIAKTGTQLHIKNITSNFQLGSLGCDHLQYLCVEFAQGDAPYPRFIMNIGDDDGGYGSSPNSLIRCKGQTCSKRNKRRQKARGTV